MSDLYNFAGGWPCNLGVPADGDPKVYAVNGILFPLADTTQIFDLRDKVAQNFISNIQSIFIDNDSDAQIRIRVGTGARNRIIAKARTQGWYPIAMLDNDELHIRSSAVVADARAINFLFANVLIIAGPWGL